LVDYTPKGSPDEPPSPEEDRTGNRIRLAVRLLALLQSQGWDVDRELRDLTAAERADASGHREEATRRVEQLLGELARSRNERASGHAPTS
jgi:hypothetical protein